MARVDSLGHFLTDVADAIRTKTGSSSAILASDFDTEIENIPTGGGITEVDEKDVNFYDYDGTRVYSYTSSEFLALESMPSNPTHSGLTAQGWNWSLNGAKNFVDSYGKVNIGQTYTTDDGSTKITIELHDGRLSPYLGFAVNGSATIDWGDNSSTEIITGNSISSVSNVISTLHTYPEAGEYTISILPSENSLIAFFGQNSNVGSRILWNNITDANSKYNYMYQSAIKEINFGENVSFIANSYMLVNCSDLKHISFPSDNTNIPLYTFAGATGLQTISIPLSVTTTAGYLFDGLTSLKYAILPENLNSIGSYTFRNCSSLQNITFNSTNANAFSSTTNASMFSGCSSLYSVVLADGVSNTRNNAFQNCFSLIKLKVPSTITALGNTCFAYCVSLKYLDFSDHTTIPTLGTNAFLYAAADVQIIVPDSLYDDWIVATNWSTYASYIIKKSDWDAL